MVLRNNIGGNGLGGTGGGAGGGGRSRGRWPRRGEDWQGAMAVGGDNRGVMAMAMEGEAPAAERPGTGLAVGGRELEQTRER